MTPRDHLFLAALAAAGLVTLVLLAPVIMVAAAGLLVVAGVLHLLRAIIAIADRRARAAEIILLSAWREARHD